MVLFAKKRRRRRRKNNPYLSKVSKLFVAVFSVLLTFTLSLGFIVYQYSNAPFTSAAVSDNNASGLDVSIWNSGSINMMIVSVDKLNEAPSDITGVSIVHFDIDDGKYRIYQLPVDNDISYPENSLFAGQYKLKDIFVRAGDNVDNGISLLKQTLGKTLAIDIDYYIVVDNDGYSDLIGPFGNIDVSNLSNVFRIKNIGKIPNLLSGFRDNAATNLTFVDITYMILFLRSVPSTSVMYYSLNDSYLRDLDKWDRFWQRDLRHDMQSTKVFIGNASVDPKIPGLAGWGSRIVKNLGLSVLDVQNSFVEVDENTLVVDNLESELVDKLVNSFDIGSIIERKNLDTEAGYNQQIFRAKYSVLLVNN